MVIRRGRLNAWLGVASMAVAAGLPLFGADDVPADGAVSSTPAVHEPGGVRDGVARGVMTKPGGDGALGSAGVSLYQKSSNLSTLSESENTLNQRAGDIQYRLKNEKDLDETAKKKLEGDLQQIQTVREARKAATTDMLARLKDPNFIKGFGSNGGEEFLSYMNISEALLASGGDDWKTWDTGITENLVRIQNEDGSWTGHHCITGRGFCTSAALLTLMADRAPVPAPKPAPGEATAISNEKTPAVETKPKVDPKALSAEVKKGLKWLVDHQLEGGGYGQGDESAEMGKGAAMAGKANVGDTCAATLALIRAGNTPTKGDYSKQIVKAVEFVCDAIEKADTDSLAITDLKGTRLQAKLGPFIDTFMAQLLLPEVTGKMPDEKSNKRVQAAADKLLKKLDKNQKKDGTWSNDGWAPVLAQSVAAKGLNRNMQMMNSYDAVGGAAGPNAPATAPSAEMKERMELNEKLRANTQSQAIEASH